MGRRAMRRPQSSAGAAGHDLITPSRACCFARRDRGRSGSRSSLRHRHRTGSFVRKCLNRNTPGWQLLWWRGALRCWFRNARVTARRAVLTLRIKMGATTRSTRSPRRQRGLDSGRVGLRARAVVCNQGCCGHRRPFRWCVGRSVSGGAGSEKHLCDRPSSRLGAAGVSMTVLGISARRTSLSKLQAALVKVRASR